MSPLSASPNSVSNAAVLLPERKTLVAPGLPLPTVRGSDKLKSLEQIMALEIEPSKYDPKKNKSVSMLVFSGKRVVGMMV